MTKTKTITVRDYYAVSGAGFSHEDARIIGPELERLGLLDRCAPQEIFAAAEDEASPLRPYFEWDKERAWRGYNERLAQHMAHHVRVRLQRNGETLDAPAFLSVRVARDDPSAETPDGRPVFRRYVPSYLAATDERIAGAAMEEAERAIRAFAARFRSIAALNPVFGSRFRPVFELADLLMKEPTPQPV